MTDPRPELVEASAVLEAATQYMRMALMGTGSVTLAQVDAHAEPMARDFLARIMPLLTVEDVPHLAAQIREQDLQVADQFEAVDEREPECVARWPHCSDDDYDPRCCRFPKSCSAGVIRWVASGRERAR